MKKCNLSCRAYLLHVSAILCLLSSYLWIAPSQVHASLAGFQDYSVSGNGEQTYMTGGDTADNQMVYYGPWKNGYHEAGLPATFASAQEQAQPQTFGLSLVEYLGATHPLQPDDSSLLVSRADVPQTHSESHPAAPLLQSGEPTTLTVSIISSPWATLDHNNPSGIGEEVPKVLVVEAVITNTGTTTATEVTVNLDYSEDPVNNWTLLSGENPNRTVDELAPGATYYAYWFARYSTIIGASHQYTVTADADNADPVATSDNYYGNPETGKTVKTRAFRSTGNSGIVQSSTDIVVGVAFTMTVEYDLGTNPREVILSPVGNADFDPSAYRLLASEVRFYNDAETQESTVTDRLYFPTVPSFADNAEATFTFIALTPSNTSLCSYTAIGYDSTDKYDQFYCSAEKGTIVTITGTLTLSLTKQASHLTIQQNQSLTYTLHYTNTGEQPLSNVWIWDDVDTAIGSVITTTIDPSSDPDETTNSRVAWDLGTVPESGQPGSTGTLTFTILIDGDDQDLADGTAAVNHAFFGVNEGSLPQKAALTSTVTTTVQAPAIALSKTDGQATVEPGDALTYTLRITNSGSITATGLIITDVLPTDVNYTSGIATPSETSRAGQTLVWDNLGPIPPNGGTVVITIPVTVAPKAPSGTILTNTMTAKYENPVGWVYATKTATDTTTVNAPVLTISKGDYPDPVLTGGLITYTLYYTNSGLAAATNVLITDVVPLSTTYQICSPSPCGQSNGVVSWTIGAVISNANGTVSFSVQVSDTLETGTLIRNQDYGIVADQTDVITGPLVTTQVNREAGFIEGYAFIDADGNGLYDDLGEDTLSGVAITLTSVTVQVTTTNSSGYYRFRVETEEPVSLAATLPPNYFRTTPGIIVFLDSVLGVTQTVNFGYAPITSIFGVIYGTVFEDGDRDGNQDLGEDGLSGVTVASSGAVTSPVTTNDLGQYTFRYNTPDTVTITETNPLYYVSTTPDVVNTTVVTGSSNSSPIDFGDFLGIKIMGQVFDDSNVNGVNDDGGGGVSGATVAADGDSFTTGSSGVYTLYVTVSDSNPITVSETDPAGYLSSSAIPGAGMSKVDANTLRIDSPVSGTVYSGDFGDVQASTVITISGQVWNDNGAGSGGLVNGLRDGTEPGLAGAVVSLSSGLTQTTGSDGLFLLYAPAGQVITVTQTNPADYVSTNAIPGNDASKSDNDTLIVSALGGGSTSADNLFGDVLASSVAIITGTVFDDANENGVFEGSETGLSGVTVTLEISGGNTIAIPTDSAGHYQFAVAPGAEVRITSAGPGGDFYPTTPESIIVRPPTAGVYPDSDFGYSDDKTDVAVISGIVFDDINSNGQQDFGESGLAGAVITLTLNGSPLITTTTSSNGLITGTFTFSVTQTGVYGLNEENPPGYRSTTPDDINVNVTALGRSYPVEFGDTNNPNTASLHGIVFDDVNGNGLQDADETGLAGVVISVTVGGGTGVLTATTKSYGQYNYGFDLTEAGYHKVSEQDPAFVGYHSTTPDEVNVFVELGNSYIVNFGDTDRPDAIIMGTVFDDDSGDGVQDPGELGIEGVLISLSNGLTTTTDSNGGYTFAITDAGFVQVVETDPGGYHSTTPNTVTVNVAAPLQGQVYTVNFGDRSDNAYGSSFFGTVFDDQNANGARDLTEPALSGVTVTISTIGGSPNPSTIITNEWGQFTFLIENAGTYTITESDLPGYVSTCAIPGNPTVTKVDNNTLRATVPITPGTDLGDNLFGDVLASQVITISGYVWDDNGAGGGIAGDGVRNGSEPYLAGAAVSLSSGMTQTTGSDGAFLLYAPSNQVITVTEANPTDYVSTNAIPGNDASKVDNDILRVSALSGGSTSAGNFFGDALPADLTVVKSDSPALVVAGTTLTYTLVYTNNGPSHAQGVYITDTLPDSVTFGGVVSVAPALFGPTQTSQSLTWYTPTLAAGASGTIVFTVTVDADASGTITNSVVIISNMPDTSPGNNDDDEPTAIAPTVDFSSATYSVDEGAGTAIITVTLDAASGLTATVDYATSDGTAVAGDDYTAISGTLTFTPGITSQTFSVNITSDTLYENDETVSLTLSNPGNATLGGNNPATLTIEDNDDPPTISINDMAVVEGDVGTTNAVFTVPLSAASGELITVDYATADGTATAGNDYTAISTTTLNFPAGTTVQTLTVQVIGDTQDEGDETFFVNLDNPTNATIADNQGVATITGDDVSPPGPGGVYLPIIVCNY